MSPEPVRERAHEREQDLLLCAAHTSLDEKAAARLRTLLGGALDWEYVVRQVVWHRVLPLLHRNLQALAWEGVPGDVRVRLHGAAKATAARNLLLSRELCRVIDCLEGKGIPVIAYKGPTLGLLAYGNLGLRPFSDLDLLVPGRLLPAARDALLARGYRLALPLTPAQEASYVRSIGQLPLVGPDGSTLVELHSRLLPRGFHFPLTAASPRRSHLVTLHGRAVRTLDPELLLLLLCSHGAKHLWAYLGWICDIAELVRADAGFDWTRLLHQARQLRCERMVLLGLYLASTLLGSVLPAGVRAHVEADGRVPALGAEVRRVLFTGSDPQTASLRSVWFHLRVRDRMTDGVGNALEMAFAPTLADWTALRLPPALSPLYYVVRAVRLARHYGHWLFMRGRLESSGSAGKRALVV
jgi:hypothetical protein